MARWLTLTRGLVLLLLVILGVVIWRNAWVGDDAFITFRTVDNWAQGHGLRWNVDERVQTYTNPLWMFALSGMNLFTDQLPLACLFVSLVVGLAAAWVGAGRTRWALAALAVFLMSRAFVDYSTSGLENPLSHLLVAWLVMRGCRDDEGSARVLSLSLLTSWLALSRLDLLLFAVPILLHALWLDRSRSSWVALALGLSPLVVWECFSIVYYGFPLPNTAYAKLGSGVPAGALLAQGMHYFGHSLTRDPVTLVAIATGLGLALRKDARARWLAVGTLLYLAYVLKVGGDFMSGRFFSVPLVAAVALGVRCAPDARRVAWATPAVVLVLGLLVPTAPLRTGPHYYDGIAREDLVAAHKIADERGFYHRATNPLLRRPGRPYPDHPWAEAGRQFRASGQRGHTLHSEMGMRGYYAGDGLHMIDHFGLVDPLLARLPTRNREQWRIGHFRRNVPEGYFESVKTGDLQFVDGDLQEYYAKLRLITRGPLFDGERWAAIVAMNLGGYDHLLPSNQP